METSKNLAQEVLGVFLKTPSKPLNYKQVAKNLGLHSVSQKKDIERLLADLSFKGFILEVSPGKYKAKLEEVVLEGVIDISKAGYGFVSIAEHQMKDVFIAKRNLKGAFQGDTVRISLPKNFQEKERPEGRVMEIIKRFKTQWVGVIQISPKFAFLVPDDTKYSSDVFIPLSKLNGAKHGDKVIAKITQWPEEEDQSPTGEVLEILGIPGERNTEIHAVLAEFGLPRGFPQVLEEEAKKIPITISTEEVAKRRDFRGITTFTIDPFDAKDFDDALSYQFLENGNIEVGVHIADVTYYVKPGGEIDKEAISRATSIYLVDRVIPMLPEILSNQVCSLRPNEDKLCFSAVFELDLRAVIQKEWFGRTIIHSTRRFTYEEVQTILENKEGELYTELSTIDSLAKKLRQNRMDHGAIAFEKEEVKFKLNEKGEPAEVFFKRQKDAHKLIEEFMLLANKRVSEFVSKPKVGESQKTFVFRVHDQPNEQKLHDFATFIKTFGYSFNAHKPKDVSKSMNSLLSEIKDKAEANLISTLAVRTMAKAAYSTNNIGHYGLAFDFYSHFTSPIRRYPDMIAHRLLQHYIDHGKSVDPVEYEALCKHCSAQEKLAEEAERASIKYMQAVYMQKFVGQILTGTVSGVTEWGIFVEVGESKSEGLIRLREIPGDFYEFEEKKYRVIGKRTKKVFQLGDHIMVKVKAIDILKKQIDLEVMLESITKGKI